MNAPGHTVLEATSLVANHVFVFINHEGHDWLAAVVGKGKCPFLTGKDRLSGMQSFNSACSAGACPKARCVAQLLHLGLGVPAGHPQRWHKSPGAPSCSRASLTWPEAKGERTKDSKTAACNLLQRSSKHPKTVPKIPQTSPRST